MHISSYLRRPSADRRGRNHAIGALVTVLIASTLALHPASPAAAAVQQQLFVAPNGDGTACSEQVPCSLATAQSLVRTAAPTMSGDLEVLLGDGVFELDAAIELDSADSGQNGSKVVYTAAPGASPIVSGGTSVTGWALHDAGLNIWEADIPVGEPSHQLYVNGRPAELARESSSVLGTITQTATGYTVTNTDFETWPAVDQTAFVYPAGGMTPTYHGDWTTSLCYVDSVSGTTVTMEQPCWDNARDDVEGPGVNVPTYIENNYTLLTEPGQFFIDEAQGTAFYIPRSGEDLATAEVVMPRLEHLIEAFGTTTDPVHDIEISNIEFRWAGWVPAKSDGAVPLQANVLEYGTSSPPTLNIMPSGLQFHTVERVTLASNVVTGFGASGIGFDGGGSDNEIIGNVVTDVAGNGIQIGNPTSWVAAPPSVAEDGYVVENNYVHHVATKYSGGIGIFAGFVKNTSISHNEVSNLPYSGISLGWGWNMTVPSGMGGNHVDQNYVHNVMDASSTIQDGGAIYLLSFQDSSNPSSVSGNHLTDLTNAGWVLYFDNSSSYWQVEGNVIQRAASKWIEIGYQSSNNTVSGNYSDNDLKSQGDSSNVFSGNVEGFSALPSGAQPIIAAAGLEPAFEHIRGGDSTSELARDALLTVSSTGSNASVVGSVDRHYDTDWRSSTSDVNASWRADLRQPQTLTSVRVLLPQSGDVTDERRNFEILVANSSDLSDATQVCERGTSVLPYRAAFECTVSGEAWRYVVVRKTDGTPLALSEVNIFGVPSPVENVAEAKESWASSEYSSTYAASNANDGNIGTIWSSSGTDTAASWEVDLGASYDLESFELVTRQDADQADPRRNFEVWVSDNADMSTGHTVACAYTTPTLAFQATYSCSLAGNTARYVSVVKTDGTFFDIAEVRVFGS